MISKKKIIGSAVSEEGHHVHTQTQMQIHTRTHKITMKSTQVEILHPVSCKILDVLALFEAGWIQNPRSK